MPMFLPNLDLNLQVKAEQTIDTWLGRNASCERCECFPNFRTIVAKSSEYFPTKKRVNLMDTTNTKKNERVHIYSYLYTFLLHKIDTSVLEPP